MLPDAEIYWHLPRAKKKPVTLLCVSSLRGRGNREKKAVTLLCVSSLRGHGNLARRIKLTRVTQENLRLKKILEVKGASCVGDPCNSMGGPLLASPRTSQWQKPSCSHLGSITWTVWPSGLRRWLKAPFRKGVGLNPPRVSLMRLARFPWPCKDDTHRSVTAFFSRFPWPRKDDTHRSCDRLFFCAW